MTLDLKMRIDITYFRESSEKVNYYTNRPRGILFPGEINNAYALLPVRRGAAPDLLVIVHEHCLFHQGIIFRVIYLFCPML